MVAVWLRSVVSVARRTGIRRQTLFSPWPDYHFFQFARLIRGNRHITHDQCHSPIHRNRRRTERLFSRCGRLNRLHRINTVDTIDLNRAAPVGTTLMVGTFDRFAKSCSLMTTHFVESKGCFEKTTHAYQNVWGVNRYIVGVRHNVRPDP